MTQLIINGITLPETTPDRYSAHPDTLKLQTEMISGRIVTEKRGTVWVVSYSYDWLPNSIWIPLAANLRDSTPMPVVFLPDNGDEMITDNMVTIELTNPTYAFARYSQPYWHNLAFSLRSERPYA